LLCLRNARAFPLLPAALASVPFGFVLVRVRVRPLQGKLVYIIAIGFLVPGGSGETRELLHRRAI